MRIRKATKKDLDGIVEFAYQLHMEHITAYGVDFKLRKNFKTLHKKHVSEKMKTRKSVFFVAEADGELVGFISGNIEEDPPVYVDRKKGKIGGLYVKESFRRKGLGKKLFAEIKKWFKKRKIKTIRLFVARSNVPTKKVYKSLGFEPADFEQLILKM